MPSLDGAITWINSQPLKTADLRGEVVFVEFWTYTCINWRRGVLFHIWLTHTRLILTDRLCVGLPIGIKHVLAALLPCSFHFRCSYVPVWPALPKHST
jgi:hypothetical protein